MTSWRRVCLVIAAGLVAAAIAAVSGASWPIVDLITLSTALVAGELVELRPRAGPGLPVAFAVSVVLLRAATPSEFVLIVTLGAIIGFVLKFGTRIDRARFSVAFLAAILLGGACFRMIVTATGTDSRTGVLVALAAAAVVQIVTFDAAAVGFGRDLAPMRSRTPDLALITSGVLMAVGYSGIANSGRLGMWSVWLFSVPLAAVWYSLYLLEQTRRTFEQTIQALGSTPELAGLVRLGHVERVADVAVALAHELGVSGSELDDLETAAWLHDLGAVCLDDTSETPETSASIARASGQMLQATRGLSIPGQIVASCSVRGGPRPAKATTSTMLMGQILAIASAYDELSGGDDAAAASAVDALRADPAFACHERVLTALEAVLVQEGLLGR